MTKQEIIKEYQLKDGDTGSAEVQIALLTERIKHLKKGLPKQTIFFYLTIVFLLYLVFV